MATSARRQRVVIPFPHSATRHERRLQSVPFERTAALVEMGAKLELAIRELLQLSRRPIRNYLAPLVDRYRADAQVRGNRAPRSEMSDDIALKHFDAELTAVSNNIQPSLARHARVLTLVTMQVKKKAKELTALKDRLADAMLAAGKTVAQLARDCGVSTVSVHKWLSGETKELRNDTCAKAAAALHVRAEWLNYGLGARNADVDDDKEIAVLLKLQEQLLDAAKVLGQHIELRRIARRHGPSILPRTPATKLPSRKKSA